MMGRPVLRKIQDLSCSSSPSSSGSPLSGSPFSPISEGASLSGSTRLLFFLFVSAAFCPATSFLKLLYSTWCAYWEHQTEQEQGETGTSQSPVRNVRASGIFSPLACWASLKYGPMPDVTSGLTVNQSRPAISSIFASDFQMGGSIPKREEAYELSAGTGSGASLQGRKVPTDGRSWT